MSNVENTKATAVKTTIGPNAADHPEWGFTTRQIHAGFSGDETTGATTPPIYLSNAFHFPTHAAAAERFALKALGPIYSRLGNPTNDHLESRLANLEGGAAALLTASGQGAITLTLLTLAAHGKNIVSSPSIYGGTYNLLSHTLPRYGVETRFVSLGANAEEWKAAADENTVAFFGKTIPNPRGDVLDLEPIAAAAHEVGVPFVVDNTVATPYLCRPIEWGADIVVHSVTKYLGGHGSVLGGVIVDAGSFDFAQQQARFQTFNVPDDSYHGLVWARDFGVGGALGANLAFILKARAEGQRDLGFAASPFNASLAGLGVDTLSLRVDRHVSNARSIAEHLAAIAKENPGLVAKVNYSGLPDSPYRELAAKYTPKGPGALLNFELTGGTAAGETFINALHLHSNVANIGDVRSIATHPASTTHSQLSPAELTAQGISGGTVRISAGLEDIVDILADIDRGLAAIAQ